MLQKFTFQQQSRVALLLFISLILVGCKISPYVEPESQDIPSGPGLFTGETGGFTIEHKSKDNNNESPDSTAEPTKADQ